MYSIQKPKRIITEYLKIRHVKGEVEDLNYNLSLSYNPHSRNRIKAFKPLHT